MIVVSVKKLIVVLSIIVVCGFSILIYDYETKTAVPNTELTVVLDAGHGGIDSGVTGINTGAKESDLNLEIVKLLKKSFENAGVNVVLTRTGANSLSSGIAGSFKKDDFKKRKEIIDKSNAVLVISIHQNFYSSKMRRGSQVFFNSDNESSIAFAKAVQNSLNYGINAPRNGREYIALAGNYYILKCTSVAAIIVECGFLSNPIDDALLSTPEFQQELAYYILTGSLNYLVKCTQQNT